MSLLNFLFGRCQPSRRHEQSALPSPHLGRPGGDRDGSSPENAVVVGSVEEEYVWMERHCPGFRPGAQSLQEIEGKPYDVLTWQDSGGEERTVYFDISEFFGR